MIAYIFGDVMTRDDSVIELLKRDTDIREIEAYNNISDFLQKVRRRQTTYERIVIYSDVVEKDLDLVNLHAYLEETDAMTTVVLLIEELVKQDRTVLEWFNATFKKSIYVDYVLEQTDQVTQYLLADLGLMRVDKIRQQHSLKTVLGKNSVQGEEVDESSDVEVEFESPRSCQYDDGIIKTFKFGGKFFGKKKLTRQELSELSSLEDEGNAILSLLTN